MVTYLDRNGREYEVSDTCKYVVSFGATRYYFSTKEKAEKFATENQGQVDEIKQQG